MLLAGFLAAEQQLLPVGHPSDEEKPKVQPEAPGTAGRNGHKETDLLLRPLYVQ